MKTIILTIALLVGSVATTWAAPLNPAEVPAGAKWVVHLDFEALNDIELIKTLREKKPEVAKKIRNWMEEEYGIDPRTDLKGLTLFSEAYKPHSGAAILTADYDQSKVKSDLMSKPDLSTTEWEGHTFYTCEFKKKGANWKSPKGDSSSESFVERKNSGHRSKQLTVVMLDRKTIVMAASVEQAKSVVKLLEGQAPSLKGKESKLLVELPKGSFLYGSFIDLDTISENKGIFPVLQQHERFMWTDGEKNGQYFEYGKFVAKSDKTAREMKTALEGMVAFMKLWAGDSEGLTKLAEDVSVNRDGKVVEARYEGSNDDLMEALGDIKERVTQWKQVMRK